eukprot:scaffold110713_cov21-Tisochrysis_lutea.AAC.1
MVGDPKQLPATLFSRSARDVLLERSLFERMAQVYHQIAPSTNLVSEHSAVLSTHTLHCVTTEVLMECKLMTTFSCLWWVQELWVLQLTDKPPSFNSTQRMSGVPVKLLAVQYRMHPEIRAFPSKFFYDDALQDAPQASSTRKRSQMQGGCPVPSALFQELVGKGKLGLLYKGEGAALSLTLCFPVKDNNSVPPPCAEMGLFEGI